jgi:LacI family transcriptional regulator
VFVSSDEMAFGLIRALHEAGRRVPDDVSVVSVDDIALAAYASPALTTVRIPLQEAGARAGRLVMGRVAPPPGGVATIPTELMVRGSTAPPAAAD